MNKEFKKNLFFNYYYEYNLILKERIKRLEHIIVKAIEYIDNHNELEQELGGTILFNLVKLENILKGEDN